MHTQSAVSSEGKPDKEIAAEASGLGSATHEAASLLLCPPAHGPTRLT